MKGATHAPGSLGRMSWPGSAPRWEHLDGEREAPLLFFVILKSSADPALRLAGPLLFFFFRGGKGGLGFNEMRDAKGVLLFQDCPAIISNDL